MHELDNPALNKNNLFKQPLSRTESKNAETDRVAKDILQSEKLAAEAKTKRLKAARLAQQEVAEPSPAPRAKKKMSAVKR